jgi:hypothetical protein
MVAMMVDVFRFALGPLQDEIPGNDRLRIRIMRTFAHLL